MKNVLNHSAKFFFLLFVAVIWTTSGCKKDKETENEVITKVVLHLTQSNGSFDQEFIASDPDGDGVFNQIDTLQLPLDGAFTCTVQLFDETKTPAVNVGAEVAEEKNTHLFVHTSTVPGINFVGQNLDFNGQPFASEVWFVAGQAGQGVYRMRLLHEPTDKNATDPGGDVDVDVSFPLVVK